MSSAVLPNVSQWNYQSIEEENKKKEIEKQRIFEELEKQKKEKEELLMKTKANFKISSKEKALKEMLENQMDEKKQIENLEKLKIKKIEELTELKMRREREEESLRRAMEFDNEDLQKRNLHETGYNNFKKSIIDKPLSLTKKRDEKSFNIIEGYDPYNYETQIYQENLDLIKKEKNRFDKRNFSYRMFHEIPKNMEEKVLSSVDLELNKLKNELNFQQNILAEQVINLKDQIYYTNEAKNRAENEIKDLTKRLNNYKRIEEIKQRELHKALIKKNNRYDLIVSKENYLKRDDDDYYEEFSNNSYKYHPEINNFELNLQRSQINPIIKTASHIIQPIDYEEKQKYKYIIEKDKNEAIKINPYENVFYDDYDSLNMYRASNKELDQMNEKLYNFLINSDEKLYL